MKEESKKPFSDPRWNDLGKPKIIGYRDIPEMERVENKKSFQAHLKKLGVIKGK